MKVLFACSEAFPLIKTGGLADVAGALPGALSELGEDVKILIPAYPEVLDKAEKKGKAIPLGRVLADRESRLIPARMPDSGVPLWLLDCPDYFDREGNPYIGPNGHDWPDNHLRFALLSRVAALLAIGGGMLDWQPDVVHANDWQTGLVPAYLRRWDPWPTPTVFTLHNINYKGLFGHELLSSLRLPSEIYSIHGIEFNGMLSFLKAGLAYSDRIVAVSPTYAHEIRDTELGSGFQGLLWDRRAALSGILNGTDEHIWNPSIDKAIAQTYDTDSLDDKAKNKAALQKEMGLPEKANAPMLGMVARMTEQKGMDLVVEALPGILDLGCQVVVVGSGKPWLEDWARMAAKLYPDRVAFFGGYDENMAHKVMAGADMFLVPSRFEPCGLTQMYALRYGTIPVVRRTGGLADTVTDAGEPSGGTGFMFDQVLAWDLLDAVRRGVALYRKPKEWRALQKRAMQQDFGWRRSAEAYMALYRELA